MAKNYFNMIAHKGQLIIVSGPSGVGKRTVLKQYLSEHPNACTSVSATTRDPRPDEVDGKDYFFLSRIEFERLIHTRQMLEYSNYNRHSYGTPKKAVEDERNAGHNVILDIDVVGAMQVRALCPDATLIFILPPSWEELERRLRNRNTEDEKTIQERLEIAKEEIACAFQYDYIIINDTIEKAVNRFSQIVHGNRYSRNSMKDFLESYIEEEIKPLTDYC